MIAFITWVREALSSFWGVAEPVIGISTLVVAARLWLLLRVKRMKKASTAGKAVIALQVGRPVTEAVKAQFGQLDILVDVEVVLGKPTLETESDYKKVASSVYSAIAANQGKEIKLVLSGPVGLQFLIGQLVGLHHFNVVVHQYDGKASAYAALPEPDRSWL